MVKITNHAYVEFEAKSINEGFARMVVAAFMMDMNPTLDELQDVKTAVSEAVTNAIIHGYVSKKIEEDITQEDKLVEMSCIREDQRLTISVVDHGVGIADIEAAKKPFFTTKPDMERSGMGFAFMETFMDQLEIFSQVGEGTRVTMTKYITGDSER